MSAKDDGVGFTPGPWHLYTGEDGEAIAVSYDRTTSSRATVCSMPLPSEHMTREAIDANAALIVTAVNAHADLVEALEEMVKKAEWQFYRIDGIEDETIRTARAALKKARGA